MCWSGAGTSSTGTPSRRSATGFLGEMMRLATADDPAVLCAQEVPAWALGLFTAGDVAARPRVGPIPIGAGLGHRLTRQHQGLLRSAFSGQGNAILVGSGAPAPVALGADPQPAPVPGRPGPRAPARASCPPRVGERTAGRAGGAPGRRRRPDLRDREPALHELRRRRAPRGGGAASRCLVRGLRGAAGRRRRARRRLQRVGRPVGDPASPRGRRVGLLRARSRHRQHPRARRVGYALRRWPDERRMRDGRLLSDHAPVELEIA